MPSDDIIAYTVEYYDEQATLARQYRLNSFKDGAFFSSDEMNYCRHVGVA